MCDADHLHKVKTEEMVPVGSTQPPDPVSCRAPRSPQAAEIDALSDALIESWSPEADVGPAAGPRRRRAGTPHEAIKAAELPGGKWLPQPAGREMYRAGRREAEAETAQRWAVAARPRMAPVTPS